MYPQTFVSWGTAERILYMQEGAEAHISHAVRDALNNTYKEQDPLRGLHGSQI
jgi:hypothetical protein